MLIKSQDDKKKRLRLLEELRKSDRLDDSQKDWLQKEHRRLKRGVAGERDAAYYIDIFFAESKNYAVLHDLRLEADGRTAQIDHLVFDRMLTFFLLETKNYNGNLIINERGEFTVEYSGERKYGIESPLEQSRRHETVLKKVLERIGITGRAGTAPSFVHVVMVHPKAIIERPPKDLFDTSCVIKADQFATWHRNHIGDSDVATSLRELLNVRGRDTVLEWGEKLRAEHRSANLLALPDSMMLKMRNVVATPHTLHEATSATSAPARADSRITGDDLLVVPLQNDAEPVCTICGKSLPQKVAKYYRDNTAWFGGKFYCNDHRNSGLSVV